MKLKETKPRGARTVIWGCSCYVLVVGEMRCSRRYLVFEVVLKEGQGFFFLFLNRRVRRNPRGAGGLFLF